MGFVKQYYMPDVDDINDEHFYFQEDAYYDALDVADEMERVIIEEEFNVVELTRTITLIKECAAEFGIECDNATAALQDFIVEYEQALKEDKHGRQKFDF